METLAVRRARAMQRDDTPLALESRLDRGAGLFARFRAKRDRLPSAAVNEPRSRGARAGRGQPQPRAVSGQLPSRSSAR